jgi:hypothetical protein
MAFETMKVFMSLSADADVESVLSALLRAKEVADVVMLRRTEKKLLNDANKRIRFKIGECVCAHRDVRLLCASYACADGKVQTALDKALVLVQASLGAHKFESYTFVQETQVSDVVRGVCVVLTSCSCAGNLRALGAQSALSS